MKYILLPFIFGYILDLSLGDPHSLWHPVCGIGSLITATEKHTRKWFSVSKRGERFAGAFLVVIVCLLSSGIPALMLYIAYRLHMIVGIILHSIMCYQLLAVKSLRDESMKVYDKLENGTIEEARYAVSMIVGRDTENLTREGVTKAAVETVAENTSDGVIAPMIYMACGGAVLGFLYKAINTMDSMVGYKNEKYKNYGFVAAKLDDIVNYIPARIAALMMIVASAFLRMDAKHAIKIYRRDRRNHASPNSAHTEAVAAGALNIQLAGNAYYFGTLYEKPTIGDANRVIETRDIVRVNRMLYVTSFLMMCFLALLLFLGGR